MTTQVDFLAPLLAPRTLRGDPLPDSLWRVTHWNTQSIRDRDTGDMLAANRDEFDNLEDFRADIARHVVWRNRVPTHFISVWGTYPRAHNWIQMECIWAPAMMWEIDTKIALQEGARIMEVELLMARLDFNHPARPQHEWVFLHRIPGKAIKSVVLWKPFWGKETRRPRKYCLSHSMLITTISATDAAAYSSARPYCAVEAGRWS